MTDNLIGKKAFMTINGSSGYAKTIRENNKIEGIIAKKYKHGFYGFLFFNSSKNADDLRRVHLNSLEIID